MKREKLLEFLGKSVRVTYRNQYKKLGTLIGTIDNVRGSEVFLRGYFPGRKTPGGGIWLCKNDIIELKEQEKK